MKYQLFLWRGENLYSLFYSDISISTVRAVPGLRWMGSVRPGEFDTHGVHRRSRLESLDTSFETWLSSVFYEVLDRRVNLSMLLVYATFE